MTISAALVRELRDQTGAPMMDCKKALEAAGGDFEGAIDHLRKSGLKKAEKKLGRSTSEGRVFAKVGDGGHVGAMVAVECETDFVANTEDFQGMLALLCEHAAAHGPADAEAMAAQTHKGGGTVGDYVKSMVGKLGENIRLASAVRLQNDKGRVAAYVHHDNKQGALLSVTTEAAAAKADEFLRSVGQHIVAIRPAALAPEGIPADVVQKEREILAQAEDVLAKPENMRAQIVEGKIRKFFAENTLLSQPFVKDPTKTVQKALEESLGKGSRIESFQLFRIGG